jgi:hypothetical protein
MGLAICLGVVQKLTKTKLVLWAVAGLLGGLGVLLAMVAIHRRPVYETCPQCDQPRRVDLEQCDNEIFAQRTDAVELFSNA